MHWIREDSYQKLKRSLKDRHTETVSRYFDRHGHLYQSEESKCLWVHDKDGVLIDKDGRACWNISIQFSCVYPSVISLILTDIFPSVHETWYLKVLIPCWRLWNLLILAKISWLLYADIFKCVYNLCKDLFTVVLIFIRNIMYNLIVLALNINYERKFLSDWLMLILHSVN